MDEADLGNEQAERNLALALAKARELPPTAHAVGACLFCFEPLARGMRWCDADCRDDWEFEQRAAQDPRNIRPSEPSA